MSERYLAAQRSGKLRLFRKLETVTLYLKNLGISHFDVDASGYDATVNSRHKRPDRAEALKLAHEAADHDAWFRKQIQDAVESLDRANAVFVRHDVVMGNLKAKLDAIATSVGNGE